MRELKAFNRLEVFKLIDEKKWDEVLGYDLQGANLQGADLRNAYLRNAYLRNADLRNAYLQGADLQDANLDFSCLPLACGGLKWEVDDRIARQIAYHFCSMKCDDEEFLQVRNAMLGFANKFHRVEECGELLPIYKED